MPPVTDLQAGRARIKFGAIDRRNLTDRDRGGIDRQPVIRRHTRSVIAACWRRRITSGLRIKAQRIVRDRDFGADREPSRDARRLFDEIQRDYHIFRIRVIDIPYMVVNAVIAAVQEVAAFIGVNPDLIRVRREPRSARQRRRRKAFCQDKGPVSGSPAPEDVRRAPSADPALSPPWSGASPRALPRAAAPL